MALFDKQLQFVDDFLSEKYLYMLYGGGVGGGKTVLQQSIIIDMAIKFPGTRYAIIRKSLKNLKRTSIPSFKYCLEQFECHHKGQSVTFRYLVNFNMSDYVARFPNGSEVWFVEADISKDPDFDKLKGSEFTTSLIEEANEIDEKAWSIIIQRTGRCMNGTYGIKPYILLNCNPANNWVKNLFYEPWAEGTIEPPYYFLPALPHDNPHNPKEYLTALESLPESEKKRYVYGDWNFSDDPEQLIQYEWLKNVINEDLKDWVWDRRENKVTSIGVDVAREGDDRTVICVMSGNRIVKFYPFKHYRHYEIANEVIIKTKEYDFRGKIGVDAVGLGSGTVDALHEKGYKSFEFKGGYKPENSRDKYTSFANLRAEAYWEFRTDIENGDIELPNNKDFIQECLNIKYKVNERVISIEDKTAYKSRHKKSPDLVDSAVIANYMRKRDIIGFKEYNTVLSEIPDTQVANFEF